MLGVAAGALFTPPMIHAEDNQRFAVQVDAGLVAVGGGAVSFLYGGFGKQRFDARHDGLRFGSVLIDYRGILTDTVTLRASGVASGDGDRSPLGFTQVFLDWRPYPRPLGRLRAKLGAFYPPFSLEARDLGWTSPYTQAPSALTTWIGEELRTVGAQVETSWRLVTGAQPTTVSLTTAAFGWNDPAGTLVAVRGWALHDRQTPLLGVLHPSDSGPLEPFRELDHRAGIYSGAQARRGDFEISAYHYDNRGNPTATDGTNFGWQTLFDLLSVTWSHTAWTFLAQSMHGRTYLGLQPNGEFANCWRLSTAYGLLSHQMGRAQLSLRYDRFATTEPITIAAYRTEDDGHAWTVTYRHSWSKQWQGTVEAVNIYSTNTARAASGGAPGLGERQVRLNARYRFGNGL